MKLNTKKIFIGTVIIFALILTYRMLASVGAGDRLRLLLLWLLIGLLVLGEYWQHRRRERNWMKIQKMESLGRLAGGLAHDFNNMLTGILGAAEAVENGLASKSPLRKYTAIIRQAGERLAALTSELLVFSRSSDNRCEETFLNQIVTDSIKLIDCGLYRHCRIEVDTAAADDVICAGRAQIESLILNLAVNARDAMPKGGVITLKTKNIRLTPDSEGNFLLPLKEGDYIELSVQDEGGGIAPRHQGRLFEPFFTTKAPGEGTGLGLAAVYGIVKRYKGNLRFETSPQGTTFFIYFPLIKSFAPQREAIVVQRPAVLPQPQLRILAVDDEKLLLELLREMLKNVGAEVVTASNPLEALKVFRDEGPFSMVMLDVVMPQMSGTELYELLRQEDKNLKVVFMSGYNRDQKINEIIAKDANSRFISKPYGEAALAEVTASLI